MHKKKDFKNMLMSSGIHATTPIWVFNIGQWSWIREQEIIEKY